MEYALGVFLGLTLLHFVAEVVSQSPGLITANPNFAKKVVFLLEILPAACVSSAALHFLITLALVLIGALLTGTPLAGDCSGPTFARKRDFRVFSGRAPSEGSAETRVGRPTP